MTKVRVQNYESFKKALLKAAKGEGKGDDLRGALTVENVAAFVRLSAPDNRELMRTENAGPACAEAKLRLRRDKLKARGPVRLKG